jgi:hypothetical protein
MVYVISWGRNSRVQSLAQEYHTFREKEHDWDLREIVFLDFLLIAICV